MNRWDDYVQGNAGPEYYRLKRWGAWLEKHPEQCPHPAIVARVTNEGTELPGTCLYCGAKDVMEGVMPEGEPNAN